MGDTKSIRDLGYMAWKNDLSWMEAQKGPRWDATVEKGNRHFTTALAKVRPLVRTFTRELQHTTNKPSEKASRWRGWSSKSEVFSPVHIWYHKTGLTLRTWDTDMDDRQTLFAAAIPVEGGYERFRLQVFKMSSTPNKTPTLIHEVSHVGPYVAFLKKSSTLIYLGSDKDTRYNTVCTWNPGHETGTITTLYTIPDGQGDNNLEIRRVEDGSVAIVKTDLVTESMGYVIHNGLSWVAEGSHLIPLAHDTWVKNGKTSLGLPSDEYLESLSLKGRWAVTRSHGIRTIWKLGNVEKAEAMVFVWGEVANDVREPEKLEVSDIRYEPYTIHTTGRWSLTPTKPHPFICSYFNTKAPCFVVHASKTKPTGLLITAYGAYGTPTKVGNLIKRWRPLLNRGWVVASVAVPGSGDHDNGWRHAGRGVNRQVAVDTLCEAVRDLQEEFGVPAKATALYGRSAGGLLVAAAVNKEPGLVGALYMESPFVDGLRTLTNLDLPLSVIESKEFGLGTNPTDVLAMAQVSPMERIPDDGHSRLLVVARTDMTDLEVYPAEVVKYMTRLKGSNKYVFVSKDRGHFTTDFKTRAEDLALLYKGLSPSRHSMTRKLRTANSV